MIHLHPLAQKLFGLDEIPEALLEQCVADVRTRCERVDIRHYRRRRAQARLELEACEAIVGAWRNFFPDKKGIFIRDRWPHVHVTIKADSARMELWIGQDYDDTHEGIEPFDIVVDRGGSRDFLERVTEKFNRTRKPVEPAPLVLETVAPPAPKPAPAPRPAPSPPLAAKASRANDILDRKR